MDISTNYLGLSLSSPIVPSAGPLSKEIGNIKSMEDNGAGAVVLYSLFEEQIEHEQMEIEKSSHHDESYAEALSYFPPQLISKQGPKNILSIFRMQKRLLIYP